MLARKYAEATFTPDNPAARRNIHGFGLIEDGRKIEAQQEGWIMMGYMFVVFSKASVYIPAYNSSPKATTKVFILRELNGCAEVRQLPDLTSTQVITRS